MKTQWSTGSMRRKWSAWSRISEAVRFGRNASGRFRAERARERAAGLGRETDRPAPVPVGIRTASTSLPSAVWKSVFSVPSRASASRSTSSVEKGTCRVSSARRPAGTFVISSYPDAPPALQRQIWPARYAGSPRSARNDSRAALSTWSTVAPGARVRAPRATTGRNGHARPQRTRHPIGTVRSLTRHGVPLASETWVAGRSPPNEGGVRAPARDRSRHAARLPP